MTTGATLFTGAGGADLGMMAAGIKMLWGLDNDPQVVAVARANGLPVRLADIRFANPSWDRVDFLLAAPPCPHFSAANFNRGETAEDLAMAWGIVRFIRVLRPRFFMLENVSAYRHSESLRLIRRELAALGYMDHAALVNFADLGVPQTRRRLILRAVRGGLVPPLPLAVPWRGWYQAVEDLLPDLPTTQFAPWQLARGVGELVRQTCMVAQGNFAEEPLGLRLGDEPAFTITSNSNMAGLRAFIVDDQYGARDENGQRVPTIRSAHELVFTISATQTKNSLRAAVNGRVVAMSPRCGARFQTIPDSYILPERGTLAWKVVGNAVPPLAMQRLCEGLLR